MKSSQEKFEEEFAKPVDLEECDNALTSLIHRKHTLNVPARPDDEDMLLSRLIVQHKALLERNKKTEILNQELVEALEEVCHVADVLLLGKSSNSETYAKVQKCKEVLAKAKEVMDGE